VNQISAKNSIIGGQAQCLSRGGKALQNLALRAMVSLRITVVRFPRVFILRRLCWAALRVLPAVGLRA
jgi:hypothetical protein